MSNIRETPVLCRKRKGDQNNRHAISGNLLLNTKVIENSPHLNRDLSIKSLGSYNSSRAGNARDIKNHKLRFFGKESLAQGRSLSDDDWTRKGSKLNDATTDETESLYRSSFGWMSNLLKKAFTGVKERLSSHGDDDSSSNEKESLNERDQKKRKVDKKYKESPLKSVLESGTFVPELNPKDEDIRFSKSPIEWDFEKLLQESDKGTNNSNSQDYGTQFIRRKGRYSSSNPESGYLRSVYKGTYQSPPAKDSTPSKPLYPTLHQSDKLTNTIKRITGDISRYFSENSNNYRTAVKDNDDLIILKEVKTTPSRLSLRFDYTDLTVKDEALLYRKILQERRQLQETAHQEKIKAQERSKVSAIDENKLKDIWKSRGKDDLKLVTIHNIDVKVMDFKTLADGRWLNDVIIEVYLKTLDTDRIFTFNSYFFTTLAERGYTGVKKWMKRAKREISKLDMIVCPINVHGTHWVLGVIKIKDKKIIYMDSLATSTNSFSLKALKYLEEYVQKESEKQGDKKLGQGFELIHRTDCPQQRNGFDCGVFTLLNAKIMVEGGELDYESSYPTQFRREIASKILSLAEKRKSNL